MIGRVLPLVTATIAAAGVAVFVSSITVASQVQRSPEGASAMSLPGAEAAKALVAAKTAKGWTPPKTLWGHPDLQGTFTTKDEANTPYERPEQFEGRRVEDITPDE